jgi:enoyl-CoA hydratase/carnithine racemase
MIGFVFTRRGLCPEGCSTALLSRLVGQTRALDWLDMLAVCFINFVVVYLFLCCSFCYRCLTGRVFEAKDTIHDALFTSIVEEV